MLVSRRDHHLRCAAARSKSGSPTTAGQLAVSPKPLLVGVSVAAAFLTPVATPANLMVLEPGGYRFGDYWKLGLPLLVLFGVLAVLLVPVFWAFSRRSAGFAAPRYRLFIFGRNHMPSGSSDRSSAHSFAQSSEIERIVSASPSAVPASTTT